MCSYKQYVHLVTDVPPADFIQTRQKHEKLQWLEVCLKLTINMVPSKR